jgi:hypothetical protein
MAALQTVAMGLVLVFLDVQPSGWGWIPGPLGWVLVLLGLSGLKELLPSAVVAVVTNVALVLALWAAGDEDEEEDEALTRIRRRTGPRT